MDGTERLWRIRVGRQRHGASLWKHKQLQRRLCATGSLAFPTGAGDPLRRSMAELATQRKTQVRALRACARACGVALVRDDAGNCCRSLPKTCEQVLRKRGAASGA